MLSLVQQQAIHQLLQRNRRQKNGNQYTTPSPDSYPYQWLWDSCFHAIILTHLEPAAAEAELSSLITKQWDDGMIPHILYWESNLDVMRINWGIQETSSHTQPPLIAYAAWRVYQTSKNRDWLEQLYPHLLRFHHYLINRQQPGRSLLGIINPDESGEDNSPRFDEALNLPSQHDVAVHREKRVALFDVHRECRFDAVGCTATSFWVEDVPFNVFMILNTEALEHIATELNDRPIAKQLAVNRHQIATAMREHMFDGTVYRSLYGAKEQKVTTVDSWSHFAPLLTGQYTKAEAKRIVETHYLSPGFSTPFRLPTVSSTDPTYNPAEPAWGQPWQHPDWRGSIWMASNWCVYHGLKRNGFTDLANELKQQSKKLITQSGFRENYHPETGIGQGAQEFTWGGLIIDMN